MISYSDALAKGRLNIHCLAFGVLEIYLVLFNAVLIMFQIDLLVVVGVSWSLLFISRWM